MSKYVDKKHGLIIGSDNVFFVVGDGPLRDGYRSVVWAQGFRFDKINSVNSQIETPANQIMWCKVKAPQHKVDEWMTDGEKELNAKYNIPNEKIAWVVSPYVKQWLNNNVGEYQKEWDTYSYVQFRTNKSLFFKRRKDGLAFVKHMETLLAYKGFGY